jgi:Spy/CpxP family protein refolding chaperone
MSVLRRMTAGFLCLALGVGTASAQQGPPGGGRGLMGGPQLEELTKALNLDAGQHAKVKAMVDKFQADTKGARETLMKNFQSMRDGSGNADALREENMGAMFVVRDGMDQLNKSIRGVLSPEQQKAFDQWLAERRQRMQQMRQGPPPGR